MNMILRGVTTVMDETATKSANDAVIVTPRSVSTIAIEIMNTIRLLSRWKGKTMSKIVRNPDGTFTMIKLKRRSNKKK